MTTQHQTDLSQTDEFGSSEAVSVVDEAAAHWLVRMTSGETTPEERAEFARWRAADPAHEVALKELRGLWVGLGPLLESTVPVKTPVRIVARHRIRRARLWALAASLVVGVGLGYQTLTTWHDEVTAAGERRSVALADGSTVTLNSATALDIELGANLRQIVLARGEAFFEVVHDASRPFLVKAGDSEVRVLGTRFSVRRDGGDVRVTVVDGRVEVRNGPAMTFLTASQQTHGGDGKLSDVASVNPEIDLSWRRGRLVLQDATLNEIVAELNRHAPTRLMVTDAVLGQRRFNAVIDLDHIDDWLLGLEQTESIRVTRLGPVVVIR